MDIKICLVWDALTIIHLKICLVRRQGCSYNSVHRHEPCQGCNHRNGHQNLPHQGCTYDNAYHNLLGQGCIYDNEHHNLLCQGCTYDNGHHNLLCQGCTFSASLRLFVLESRNWSTWIHCGKQGRNCWQRRFRNKCWIRSEQPNVHRFCLEKEGKFLLRLITCFASYNPSGSVCLSVYHVFPFLFLPIC